MSNREIVQLFRQAKDPVKQIYILADLNLCHWSVIVEVLRAEGIKATRGHAAEKGGERMTRKRFIKILMGAGLQRNKAVKMADIALRNGVSYEDAFFEVVNVLCGTIKQIMQIIETAEENKNEP